MTHYYETEYGTWTEYGNDGRATTGDPEIVSLSNYAAGTGWRARKIPNVLGGDYGWGPLAETTETAISLAEADAVAHA